MTGYLRDHPEDLQALVAATAESLGVDPAFVEKDFWAIEVLRAVTRPRTIPTKSDDVQDVVVIFKGGTSLSRVYALVERFSEDVDVLVRFPNDASAKSKDGALKAVCADVQAYLGLTSDQCALVTSSTGVKRNIRFHHPTRSTSAALSRGVLLEMGTRGGTHPSQRHWLRSLAADYAVARLGESADTWNEFQPFELDVLSPERTLLEKLAALHDAGSRVDRDDGALLKAGRHYYDVHKLLSDAGTRANLEALGRVGIIQLVEDIERHSRSAKFSYTPRPTDGYADSPAFADHGSASTVASRAYAGMVQLVYGELPSLDECRQTVRDAAHLI